MQPPLISKETTEKIIIAIKRSQMAYEFYKEGKLYYQALRIFKANEKIYDLLNTYLYECDESQQSEVIRYIFHLEDWFSQFRLSQAKDPALEDQFIFYRFEDSPPFPDKFIDLISK